MEFLETLPLNSRIDLRGRNVGVPEQSLNDPEVCSALQEMGCKGVPQHVRRDATRDPGRASVAAKELPKSLTCHPATGAGDKESIGDSGLQEGGPASFEVHTHLHDRGLAERDYPLFGALAERSEKTHPKIDRVQLQGQKFGGAKASGIEDFEHGIVA